MQASWSHSTDTAPVSFDEFNDEFPFEPPRMTREQMAEASALLSTLHQLVGEQAAEVMGFLVTVLHRRDGASMSLLRFLRSLDSEARG